METTFATTGADIKEFLRENQIDTRDLLLASQTGIIDDSMFINRIGLRNNCALVVVPKTNKKKGIPPMRSLCAMPSLRPSQFPNSVTIEPETKIRASSSIRSVFPKFNRHSLPF
ncbi:hypothetical protein TVAG_146120 [Trichomonas vaginalis G3]|uniref:Uncharacterized protein n=1 Tax=Trichomonas vaginalis (strain ATCC PRA-98 / G3) TaxID=412133 RepID=A2F8B5_TRIV3|nr:hypothetical protein TVAGG3_0038470 [Trichomonas vaginalis G3]EAX98875.1 hypothetical protein TVAG_146120 [Trichomonas vaginalis G3]KAI5540547.1 hypothetical protein TVAGG3_0038470 [Trichomonas vaginalis G3]|eukprot:XP_001311805.1 hypothetical protein [Trichomonas vaginalis G3]